MTVERVYACVPTPWSPPPPETASSGMTSTSRASFVWSRDVNVFVAPCPIHSRSTSSCASFLQGVVCCATAGQSTRASWRKHKSHTNCRKRAQTCAKHPSTSSHPMFVGPPTTQTTSQWFSLSRCWWASLDRVLCRWEPQADLGSLAVYNDLTGRMFFFPSCCETLLLVLTSLPSLEAPC